MTARRDTPPDLPKPDAPLLGEAESAELGAHISALAAKVEAPASLRARVAHAATASSRPRRRLLRPAVAAGGLAALAAVVLVLAGVGSGPSAPSIDDAAALALAAPTAPAPAVERTNTELHAYVGKLAFPNYRYIWPRWKAAGARADRLSGRATRTVTYRGPRGDVGYTIVDGEPLKEPQDARHRTAAGIRLAIFRRGDATVVTWRRGGHTCVLAGRGPGVEAQLVKFATWA
jgi:hypothetical protein